MPAQRPNWESLLRSCDAPSTMDGARALSRTKALPGLPSGAQRPGSRVEARGLGKWYGRADGPQIVALGGVDLDILPGEVVAVRGPSGSGKSTLLNLLGGMDSPSSGELLIDGTSISRLGQRELVTHRRQVGFVFQAFHLLPMLNALDNVLIPLLPHRTSFDRVARAHELLEAVGLGTRADALPSQLSGGEQQRVAIARALVNDPRLLLADEPTGNLDSATGALVLDVLLDLKHRNGFTMVIATHDPAVAQRCDWVVRLADGALLAQ